MGPGAARTTVEWLFPDLPSEDLASGRRQPLFPSQVSPRVVQTVQVKAFPILLRLKCQRELPVIETVGNLICISKLLRKLGSQNLLGTEKSPVWVQGSRATPVDWLPLSQHPIRPAEQPRF